jgi:type I restriction enzyme, S subunit
MLGPLETAVAHAQGQIDLIRESRTRLIADVVTGQADVRHLARADVVPLTGNLDETEDVVYDELATAEESAPDEGVDDADE